MVTKYVPSRRALANTAYKGYDTHSAVYDFIFLDVDGDADIRPRAVALDIQL